MFIVGNAQMAMGGFGADIIYISIFHNNHTCAAGSLVTVIADGALGNRAVLVVHTGGLGALQMRFLISRLPILPGVKRWGNMFAILKNLLVFNTLWIAKTFIHINHML